MLCPRWNKTSFQLLTFLCLLIYTLKILERSLATKFLQNLSWNLKIIYFLIKNLVGIRTLITKSVLTIWNKVESKSGRKLIKNVWVLEGMLCVVHCCVWFQIRELKFLHAQYYSRRSFSYKAKSWLGSSFFVSASCWEVLTKHT